MSYLNSDLEDLASRLDWSVRVNPENQSELIIGDYARGFLIMSLEQEIQLAQRALRGAPSLKLRTNDLEAAQKYLVFQMARLVRFREGRADLAIPVDSAAVSAPYQLRATPFECVLSWGNSWIEFGAGNSFAATQFFHYAQGNVEDTIHYVLGDAPSEN